MEGCRSQPRFLQTIAHHTWRLPNVSDHCGRCKCIYIPISVTTLVTCSSSMPEKPVELMVRPENPGYVSDQ